MKQWIIYPAKQCVLVCLCFDDYVSSCAFYIEVEVQSREYRPIMIWKKEMEETCRRIEVGGCVMFTRVDWFEVGVKLSTVLRQIWLLCLLADATGIKTSIYLVT